MIKNYSKLIIPNKKINFFVLTIVFLGIISGSIFATLIGFNDKSLVIDKIKLFIDNINTNSIDTILALKNSLSINLSYVIIIWILGMTIIGILFILFLLYIKSFIFGFSLSAFIITYSYKGIILSILYTIFGQVINIIIIILLTIYSLMFTKKLMNLILKNDITKKTNKFLKTYIIVLIITIIISIISSLSEIFILPSLIKIIIKLFV